MSLDSEKYAVVSSPSLVNIQARGEDSSVGSKPSSHALLPAPTNMALSLPFYTPFQDSPLQTHVYLVLAVPWGTRARTAMGDIVLWTVCPRRVESDSPSRKRDGSGFSALPPAFLGTCPGGVCSREA